MKKSSWETIDGFKSLGEFKRFLSWLQEQVAVGIAQEAPVASPYLGATAFQEKWYIHLESGERWRLVWPDGPFTGLFEPVCER